jgi:hypothetical protein
MISRLSQMWLPDVMQSTPMPEDSSQMSRRHPNPPAAFSTLAMQYSTSISAHPRQRLLHDRCALFCPHVADDEGWFILDAPSYRDKPSSVALRKSRSKGEEARRPPIRTKRLSPKLERRAGYTPAKRAGGLGGAPQAPPSTIRKRMFRLHHYGLNRGGGGGGGLGVALLGGRGPRAGPGSSTAG